MSDTFGTVSHAFYNGIYTEEEIDGLINKGFVPIASAKELDSIRNDHKQTFGIGTKWKGTYYSGLDGKYVLVNNIDLGDAGYFVPIGAATTNSREQSFRGIFNGNGNKISNLMINHSRYTGLFGRIDGASITNVYLDNVDVTGESITGGLVGTSAMDSDISNIYVTGSVKGNGSVGGLVGDQHPNASIVNGYSSATVTGNFNVGGLLGYQHDVDKPNIRSSGWNKSNNDGLTGIGSMKDYGVEGLSGTEMEEVVKGLFK